MGAELVEINEREFKVLTQSSFVQKYVEQNQNQICALMEDIIGRKLKMVCRSADQQETREEKPEMQRLADELNSKFEFDVPITVK